MNRNEVQCHCQKADINNAVRQSCYQIDRKGDYIRMAEIEELLDNTGFDFDYYKWQKDVDEKYGK